MADYKSMYYHLAGRMAVAVDTMEMAVQTLTATSQALMDTTKALAELTDKLKLAQQTTEDMFLDADDEPGDCACKDDGEAG